MRESRSLVCFSVAAATALLAFAAAPPAAALGPARGDAGLWAAANDQLHLVRRRKPGDLKPGDLPCPVGQYPFNSAPGYWRCAWIRDREICQKKCVGRSGASCVDQCVMSKTKVVPKVWLLTL